jgi:hypothetical protein
VRAAAANRDEERLYVYALLAAAVPAPARSGIAIEPVGGLFAAVARPPASAAVTEAALRRQHRVVIRLNDAADGVLPVRFGTVLPRHELERIVRSRRAALRGALRRIRAHRQLTVRVHGPGPAGERASIDRRTGAGYLRDLAAASRPLPTKPANVIRRAVRPLLKDERLERGRDSVAVVMHHLIPRRGVDRYLQAIEQAMRTMADAPVVEVAGPFPAFAFVPDLRSDEI